MNLDSVFVSDIETTGFLPKLKSFVDLHVLSCAYKNKEGKWCIKSTYDRDHIVKLLSNPNNIIIGHNFKKYDIPALEKMLGIKNKAFIIDTLLLAWYLEPNRIKEGKKYGLESYGEEYGIPKPEIEDWENLSYEEYKHRCEEDVKINVNLWTKQLKHLRELYDGDDDRIISFIRFLMCKGDVAAMQEKHPLKIDKKACEDNLDTLTKLLEDRVDKLKKVMPKTPIKAKKKKPKIFYKKDGTLSANAIKWLEFLKAVKLPEDHEEEVEYIRGWEEPNPTSPSQVKDWLFSLGWKPEIFVETTLTDGSTNSVPQVKDKDKNLCESVKKLAKKDPAINELEDVGVIQHRMGYLKGFLRDIDEECNIIADIGGLTNTLRWKHRTLVNLPKPSAPYGEYIRSVIIPEKGKRMLGSDLSSLESQTRNHFIHPIDPDYVKEMSDKYYDAHLDIGITAGLITEAEALFYKWWKEKKKNPKITPEDIGNVTDELKIILDSYKADEEKDEFFEKLDKVRANAKTTNYSALYKVGKVKLSKELKITQKKAKTLLDAFWKKNYSVGVFSDSCEIKEIRGQKWVLNPLNKYWYSLRTEKDVFSTVNQGTGDYIQTLWLHHLMNYGVVIQGNFHDEYITTGTEEELEQVAKLSYAAIDKVNKQLKLNVQIGIDYKINSNYAKVH